MKDENVEYFTTSEVGELFHVSGQTVRRWIESGELKADRKPLKKRNKGVKGGEGRKYTFLITDKALAEYAKKHAVTRLRGGKGVIFQRHDGVNRLRITQDEIIIEYDNEQSLINGLYALRGRDFI